MTGVGASQDPAAPPRDPATARDQAHMARALSLAARGLYTTDPNPRVGCVVVRDDRVLGEGWHVLAGEARDLNVGFFSRFERGRPFVRLKLAMSLDARTAPASGGQAWISGEAARADVQVWRARSGAVLTGAGTVRTDDPRLDVRLAYGSWVRQPLRVLLDPMLTCATSAKLFHGDGALVFAAPDAPVRAQNSARVERLPRAAGGLDLRAVIRRLAELEINELLVECGPRLAGSFILSNLVDEFVLYMAPALLGADAAPLAHVSGLGPPGSLPPFEFKDVQRIGDDLRLILIPKKP